MTATREPPAAGARRPHSRPLGRHRRRPSPGEPRWRAGARVVARGDADGAAVTVTPVKGATVTLSKQVVWWIAAGARGLGTREMDEAAVLAAVACAFIGRRREPGQEVGSFVEDCLALLGTDRRGQIARRRLGEVGLEAAAIGRAMADARRKAAGSADPDVEAQCRRTVEWLLRVATVGGGVHGALVALSVMDSELSAGDHDASG
jgi:hypothetical protein